MTSGMLKIGQVVELTTLHRATIYRLIESGKFPRNRKLSPQRVGWPAAEVDAWLKGEWPAAEGPSGGPNHQN